MDFTSSEVLSALTFLLTGFVAQWVFHGLTAHPRRSDFDRIIHALILTTLIAPISFGTKELLLLVGQHWGSITQWKEWSPQATSVVTAILFGFFLAVCANNGWPHKLLNWQASRSSKSGGRTFPGRLSQRLFPSPFDNWLRQRKLIHNLSKIVLTKKTTAPSEWLHTFSTHDWLWIILHLPDGRRLYGYPIEFPDNPDSGHFVLGEAEWLHDDNTMISTYPTKMMLIPSKDVGWVEFVPCISSGPSEQAVHHESNDRQFEETNVGLLAQRVNNNRDDTFTTMELLVISSVEGTKTSPSKNGSPAAIENDDQIGSNIGGSEE